MSKRSTIPGDKIVQIRNWADQNKATIQATADQFGISVQWAWKILTGKKFTDLGGPIRATKYRRHQLAEDQNQE